MANTGQTEVFYAGRVQGVGFRYTVRSLATKFVVAGFVRNLPDGRVQVLAEGEKSEIDRFLTAIQTEMGYYIGKIETTDRPASGDYRAFEIRH